MKLSLADIVQLLECQAPKSRFGLDDYPTVLSNERYVKKDPLHGSHRQGILPFITLVR